MYFYKARWEIFVHVTSCTRSRAREISMCCSWNYSNLSLDLGMHFIRCNGCALEKSSWWVYLVHLCQCYSNFAMRHQKVQISLETCGNTLDIRLSKYLGRYSEQSHFRPPSPLLTCLLCPFQHIQSRNPSVFLVISFRRQNLLLSL